MDFDPKAELAQLREQTKTIRKRRYSRSRLDKYTGELLSLHREGATTAQLQRWLRRHRIKVVHSTVARWLAKHG
ncbi:hypothetical protein AB9R84_15700 (plasmid) [Oceanimonas smirnovii]|uniref:hypothetical protein n=1 Tax=Oceanimonas smirnovii TaxID=264574 RepID=UPI003AAE6FC2